MKRNILVLGIIVSVFGITSCLDNDDTDFVPKIAETNNSYYGKGGKNDSIPPEDNDSTTRPPTGGEVGQTPVKP